jgi:phosphosulfolactate phosphohydrolase-like enzyme
VIVAMTSVEMIGVMIDVARTTTTIMTTTARSALHHHHLKGTTPMVHSN